MKKKNKFKKNPLYGSVYRTMDIIERTNPIIDKINSIQKSLSEIMIFIPLEEPKKENGN